MKKITDKQYEHLQYIALRNGITLNGYTVNSGLVSLQNSRRIITGETMWQLIDWISSIKYN